MFKDDSQWDGMNGLGSVLTVLGWGLVAWIAYGLGNQNGIEKTEACKLEPKCAVVQKESWIGVSYRSIERAAGPADEKGSSVVRPESAAVRSDAIIKWLVAAEVERKENVSVQSVTIISPGVARAEFPNGVADVQYGFTDLLSCPIEKQQDCAKEAMTNPLGFKVVTYAKRPIQ